MDTPTSSIIRDLFIKNIPTAPSGNTPWKHSSGLLLSGVLSSLNIGSVPVTAGNATFTGALSAGSVQTNTPSGTYTGDSLLFRLGGDPTGTTWSAKFGAKVGSGTTVSWVFDTTTNGVPYPNNLILDRGKVGIGYTPTTGDYLPSTLSVNGGATFSGNVTAYNLQATNAFFFPNSDLLMWSTTANNDVGNAYTFADSGGNSLRQIKARSIAFGTASNAIDSRIVPGTGQLDVRADNGLRVRNFANSADADITANKVTASYEMRATTSMNAEGYFRLSSTGNLRWSPSSTGVTTTGDDIVISRFSAGLLDIKADNGIRVLGLNGSSFTPIQAGSVVLGGDATLTRAVANTLDIRADNGFRVRNLANTGSLFEADSSGNVWVGGGFRTDCRPSTTGTLNSGGSGFPWLDVYQRGAYINYNSGFSGTTNYERGYARWNSNVYEIGTEIGGTGVARTLRFKTQGAANITLEPGGGAVGFSGHLYPNSGGTYDLGWVSGGTWSTGYINKIIAAVSASSPMFTFSGATDSGMSVASAIGGSRALNFWTDNAVALTLGGSGTSRAATFAGNLLAGGYLFIPNQSAPATPTGGGRLYVESGALKYIGSSGTITTLAAA